jgi:hypothetical protein
METTPNFRRLKSSTQLKKIRFIIPFGKLRDWLFFDDSEAGNAIWLVAITFA